MEQQFIQYLVAGGALRPHEREKLQALARHNQTPIGMIALGYALMSLDEIDDALVRQQETGERFGEAAVALGAITLDQVERLLEVQRFRRAAFVVEGAILSGMLSNSNAIEAFGLFLRKHSTSVAV